MSMIANNQKKLTQTLQQVVERVLLGDWRTLSKEELFQDAARVRSAKAHYIATHLTHQGEIRQDVLTPLDQTLIAVYLLLDTLEGRDLAQQRAMYQALLEAQTPLLLACSGILSVGSVGEVQVSEEEQAILQIAERSAQSLGPEEPQKGEGESVRHDSEQPDLVSIRIAPEQEKITPRASAEIEVPVKSTRFYWTEERERQLQEAITQGAGSLDQVNMAVIKQIAARYDWPRHAIEYKVRRLKEHHAPHESQQDNEAATKEGD